MGRLRWTVGALAVGAVLASQVPTSGAPSRRVIGTIDTIGDVSLRDTVSTSTAEMISDPRVPLTEGNVVETGSKAGAVLTLHRDGMVGLRANSLARGMAGPRVEVLAGSALVRLAPTSHLVVSTPSGSVRTDLSALEPTGAGYAEGTVSVLPAGKTLVRVERGALYVQTRGGEPILLKACEQAILAPSAAPRVIVERRMRPTASDELPSQRPCRSGGTG
jgi:hypothetical protein